MSVEASIAALRHDAQVWQRAAGVCGQAAAALDPLALTESDLSWASRPTGLLDTYEQIRTKTARLLDEATITYQALSDTLDLVADRYTDSDTTAAGRLADLWQPR